MKNENKHIEEQLKGLKRDDLFNTPAGYFDQMQQDILQQIQDIPQERKAKVISLQNMVRVAASILFAVGLAWTMQHQIEPNQSQIASIEEMAIEEIDNYLLEYDEEDILTAYAEMTTEDTEENSSWLTDDNDKEDNEMYIEYILDEELSIEEILQTDPELFEELCIAC